MLINGGPSGFAMSLSFLPKLRLVQEENSFACNLLTFFNVNHKSDEYSAILRCYGITVIRNLHYCPSYRLDKYY